MRQKIVVRYSQSFKQQVIADIESGRFSSIMQAQEHYGITGSATIQNWLNKYGRNHLCAKVVHVEKPNEKDKILELKKQIKQLKEALGQTQAENILNQEFLKIACEEIGQDIDTFKKKAGTELFTRQDKPDV
jgi:transposase-like protein